MPLFVGERDHGACAGADFFDALSRDFERVETYAIPKWSGRHDDLTVWQRKH